MTITVEQVRERYPKQYWDLSDQEIQCVLDYMYFICDFSVKWHMEHPGESFVNRKKEELDQQKEIKLNKERHLANKMPIKATLDEKIKRHIEHVVHCKCRPMPEKIKQEIKKRLG